MVPLADRGPALDQYVGVDLRVFANGNVLADDRIGADLDSFGQPGVRMHDCRRVYLYVLLQSVLHGYLSTTMAISSASATTAPSTSAFALRLIMVDRSLTTSSSKRTWSPGVTGLRNFALS